MGDGARAKGAPDAPGEEALARRVVRAARSRGVTVGCAESCTGGLVCGALTSVPGSSAALVGGVVSYATSVKARVLGVAQDVLSDPARGAVSAPCAAQMAEGVTRVVGSDFGVSVTGIAGPDGAEPGRPVGTVWFGVHGPDGTRCVLERFSGDRASVRRQAVRRALRLLCEEIEGARP
ncbi:CinA family protein [Olsenella massiliensis]|uniref:CinA family protein n=1 Tax=Olsenella massiliensis TaxID=1622075 RepID=UPI00071DB230|nr:CinA family protein [Olsenella massiliensis]